MKVKCIGMFNKSFLTGSSHMAAEYNACNRNNALFYRVTGRYCRKNNSIEKLCIWKTA